MDYVPHDVECEQQVLGALLLATDGLPTIEADGGENLFHDAVHKAIYSKIRSMDRNGILASPSTLAEWARAYEPLSELGGAGYLMRIAGATSASSHMQHYCRVLAETRARRLLMDALRTATSATMASDQPADVIAARLEGALMAIEGTGNAPRPISMTSAVSTALEQVMAARNGDTGTFVQTGIESLDNMVTGLYPGELILLGGRPSMGKTSVALNVALNAARAGHGVVICSLEMNPEAMALRALSEGTARISKAISYRDIRGGDLTDWQMEALAESAKEVASLPIQFLSRQYADIGAMAAGAKQAKRIMGNEMGLLIVDYAQLLKVQGARSRYDEVSEISRSLKALAGQLNVPILALSQLSRALESRDDKRPMLSDLRESGQLEQDADAVMFCYRDEYYLEREQPEMHDNDAFEAWQNAMEHARNRLEIIVAKQRQGPIGTANVYCNVALNRIWEAHLG
ncbi:replicative DNA helicase [Oceaniglobus ichthyenteri]|uniref:replicative DNA helicase n=1 Tax=Oceaniglobus ichthyenteri TaxID=2136177 RepID=UPI0013DDC0DA|nr:replicative DNA helicase [Oceaniglobus ichthyenteri]